MANSDPVNSKLGRVLKQRDQGPEVGTAAVWKLGFDKDYINGLSNSLVMKVTVININ